MTPGLGSARRPRRLLTALVSIVCAVGVRPAVVQTITPPELKAAFIYNFATFVDWPPDVMPRDWAMAICVVGDDAVAEALTATARGHAIGSHEIAVMRVTLEGPLRSCHVLYVPGLEPKRVAQLVDLVRGSSVFTVSDVDRFAETGGIAQLFIDNDKMRFAINVDAAQRAHLHLSSQLLALATIVKDDHRGIR